MQNALQVLKNKKFGTMHGYEEGGVAFLNLGDIARCLDFITADGKVRSKELNRLLKKAGHTKKFNTHDYVPESVFYLLAMWADSPNAEDFQKWLACSVVPQIRQTGSYNSVKAVANPKLAPQLTPIRQKNIAARKKFTSVIQSFCNYAKWQGDTRKDKKIYSKLSKLANDCARIASGNRPVSDDENIAICTQAESFMAKILLEGMADGAHYTRIESKIELEINNFARYVEPSFCLLSAG